MNVADETAFIIWDQAAKMQHFIRRATFDGTGYDLAFLVPTPHRPQLEEADGTLFDDLAKITAPKTEYREVTRDLDFGCGMFMAKRSAADAAAGGVVVLEQKRVGDLDAAVLAFRPGAGLPPEEAAGELLEWLNRNRYAVRPDLIEWLKPYAQGQWIITAFKIAKPPTTTDAAKGNGEPEPGAKARVGSTTVRMSFKADRPFFPYREPADQRDGEAKNVRRLLRVFVAARQRMAGQLGDGAKPWPGQTVWANAVTDPERLGLLTKAGKLPEATAPGPWWVTELEDRSSPRPGTDEVYFEPAADQSVVARRPLIVTTYRDPWWRGPVQIGVPIVLLISLVLLLRYGYRRWTAARKPQTP